MKKIIFLILGIISSFSVFSQNYIGVEKEAKLYDDANAKYPTVNQNNEEVIVVPGMAFRLDGSQPGWFLIEYFPGLRAYIQEALTTKKFELPDVGNFKVKNNPAESLKVEMADGIWKGNNGKQVLTGVNHDNVIIFLNENNEPAYSLIKLNGENIVVTYDNNVTGLF